MSDDRDDEGRTTRERDRNRKYEEHVARLQRRERLDGCVKDVRLIYQALRHRSKPGTEEWSEFDRLWRHHGDIEKSASLYTREEQDQILAEYPKLAASLRSEYGL